jgi:SAM-dependent methyltransferase
MLPLAEQARFWGLRLTHARRNRGFRARHPAAVLPPLPLMYEAYGHVDYGLYTEAGYPFAEYLAAAAASHLGSPTPYSVCEWGCGPARILRHLPALLPDGCRVFGTDYDPRTIAWCSANLSGISFRLNGLAPPLPFATHGIDLLYAVSVLTHLPEDLQVQWMAECVRVVRPGGLILLTVHGDRCTDSLSREEREQYRRGRLVVRARVRAGTRAFVAYQSPRFMREVLLRDVEILAHNPPEAPMPAGGQDLWVIRTRPGD